MQRREAGEERGQEGRCGNEGVLKERAYIRMGETERMCECRDNAFNGKELNDKKDKKSKTNPRPCITRPKKERMTGALSQIGRAHV